MTYTKKALVLPVLVAMITVLVVFSGQNVMALTTTIHDTLSCQSAPISGVWTAANRTCTVGTLVVGPADTVGIAKFVTLSIGTVTSSGVIQNNGTILIASGGVVTTSGTVNNNGIITSQGTITNSGPFNNFGSIVSTMTITNGPTGTITTNGGISSTGVITSSGSIIINTLGTIDNHKGTFTNTLNLVNNGTILTSGTFTNSGPVMNNGVTINTGLITNSNTITNAGFLYNLCGGKITNSGTISGHTAQNIC